MAIQTCLHPRLCNTKPVCTPQPRRYTFSLCIQSSNNILSPCNQAALYAAESPFGLPARVKEIWRGYKDHTRQTVCEKTCVYTYVLWEMVWPCDIAYIVEMKWIARLSLECCPSVKDLKPIRSQLRRASIPDALRSKTSRLGYSR